MPLNRWIVPVILVVALTPFTVLQWKALLSDPASEHVARGEKARADGEAVTALLAYKHAAQLDPTDPDMALGFMKARVATAAHDPRRIDPETTEEIRYSAEYLMEATDFDRSLCLTAKGNALAVGRSFLQALEVLQEAVAADTKSASAHLALGMALVQTGGGLQKGLSELEAAQLNRDDRDRNSRARSVPAEERYRSAQRYSIARSRERLLAEHGL